MWTKEITDMIINGVWATLYMTVASTVLGYVFGLQMGVLLAITDKEGLTPNAVVYKILFHFFILCTVWSKFKNHLALCHAADILCICL